MMKKFTLLFFASILFLASCVKEGADVTYFYYEEDDYKLLNEKLAIPQYPANYDLSYPTYFTSENPRVSSIIDDGMATIGRVLFYDKNLSSDKSVSCASCHKQELAFSDDKAFSDGVSNRATTRNSISLGSTFNFRAYYGNPTFGGIPFFWDNSAFSVSEQAERTLANPNEMGMHISEVVSRVKDLDYYKAMFRKETNGRIDKNTVLQAISEFVNAMNSYNSKFDAEVEKHFKKYNQIENIDIPFSGFTTEENRGKKLYLNNCASCHNATSGAPDVLAANNGLTMDYADQGIYNRTGNESERGLFKVPTLRNITMSAPYMHDGSIATLEGVIDHYSNGIQNHPNLHEDLKTEQGTPKKMNFTEQDKNDLIAFFMTMEDHDLMHDEKFSDPFRD